MKLLAWLFVKLFNFGLLIGETSDGDFYTEQLEIVHLEGKTIILDKVQK